MDNDLILEKKYNKMISSIDRVSKIYHFNLVHNPNIHNKGIYYYSNNSLIINYYPTNDFEYAEGISFIDAIFKAFGLKLNIELSEKNRLYELINSYISNDLFEINNEIEGIALKSNSIILGEINLMDDKYNAYIDLDKFFKLILESGKNLIVNDNLHVIFITDKKANRLCYKSMNICRIGGLSCKMVYEDFTDSDIEPTRFLVDFDEESTINNTVNIKDMISEHIEEISISDIYPYIINKINKLSKCSSCKEE